MIVNSCKEEPHLWQVDSSEQVMADYIASHPGQFSEFDKLISATGKGSLLHTRGPFTLFLPTDEAMLSYYMEKNVHSLADFSDSALLDLIFNHIVGAEISCNEIGLGRLRETNALGDNLVTEFQGAEIMINKHARIIDRDIRVSNGYIHVLDQVLDPVTRDIFSVILSDPSYQIFSEGLELTGLKDTLKITSFPFGHCEARTRFTLLAVADTIYQRYGIQSVEDLIAWCGTSPDSVTFLDNPFYRYMEYHCIQGSHYLSDLETGIYPTLSGDNNLSFTIDTDYKINYNPDTETYTGFIISPSNTPAKNGVLHAIDDLLPAIEPAPGPVIFETTDFFDLKTSDYYGKCFMRCFDGENTFEKIKWEGDYFLYYYIEDNWALENFDCLSMQGWWTISITFPKVMKGEYEIFVRQPTWLYMSDCRVYLDGVPTGIDYLGSGGTNDGSDAGSQKIAEASFSTTSEHTITLRAVTNGFLFWDYVRFEPVR